MRMDTVIMGGDLSGLTCGIALAKRGQRVTIVAGGQSTLMFNGGSMELLGNIDGQDVTKPLQAITTLPQNHPYSKIGDNRIAEIADEAKQLLADAGINMAGDATANHWRITPMGIAKPAWLTLSENLRIDDLSQLPAKRVALMCIRGYFDQPNGMLAQGLRDLGFDVLAIEFTTDDISALRDARHQPGQASGEQQRAAACSRPDQQPRGRRRHGAPAQRAGTDRRQRHRDAATPV